MLSKLVLSAFREYAESESRIAIVGQNVISFTTALSLLERNSSLQIDLYPEENPESPVFWNIPVLQRVENLVQRKWSVASFEHFQSLYRQRSGINDDVNLLSGYVLSTNLTKLVREEEANMDLAYNIHHLRINEMLQFPTQKEQTYLFGLHYTTYTVNPKNYMNYLLQQLREFSNVRLQKTPVKKLLQLYDDYDIIVNCDTNRPGILANDGDDKKFVKHRQTFLELDANYMKHFLIKNFDTFIVPALDNTFVVYYERLDKGEVEDAGAKDNILDRVYELQPSLKSAALLRLWYRVYYLRQPGPRVEMTTLCHPAPKNSSFCLESGSKVLQIMHNYDGDAYNFETAWGRAKHVADLLLGLSKN
uniref:Uncharacterized protein n=1 Tax=Syphacia muris TaxID=451379 RepID=A0A0N5APL6_9BILA